MNVFEAELKYYLRSPIIWLMAAVAAFIGAWSLLMAVDVFAAMQVKFAAMTDAPTITQGLVFPLISVQAKLLLLLVPILAGLSFARLNNHNGWSIVDFYALSGWHLIGHKYLAVLVVMLLFVAPSIVAVLCLAWMQQLPMGPIFLAMLGLLLLSLWLLALCMYVSAWVANSGFAILLCLLIVVFLWMISFSGLQAEWGKNWIQVLSPHYHFRQFSRDYLPFSAIVYFVLGAFLCLLGIKIRLRHKRYTLS